MLDSHSQEPGFWVVKFGRFYQIKSSIGEDKILLEFDSLRDKQILSY